MILLPLSEEVLEDNTFKKTPKAIVKQLASIRMILNVTEYHADVYYNSQTVERVHAAFSCYTYRLYKWKSGWQNCYGQLFHKQQWLYTFHAPADRYGATLCIPYS